MKVDTFVQELESSVEFKLLDKVVKGEVSVEDACHEVVRMTFSIFAAAGKGHDWFGVGNSDYRISLSTLEFAERLEPSKQTKLVEFMLHLNKQAAIDPSTNILLRSQGSAFWADMPSFGYTELETWEHFGGDYHNGNLPNLQFQLQKMLICIDPCDPKMNADQRDRWTKLNAFDAQLTQAADVIYPPPEVYRYPKEGIKFPIHPLDKSLRAMQVMQMTLESDHAVGSLVDTAAMEATCLWFIYAADQLWANSVKDYTYPRSYSTGPGGKLWGVCRNKHWSGFTRDRWEVWEEVLEDASGTWGDERMMNMINEALESMRRAVRNKVKRL
ncbi:hypothetical protein N7456_001027 [Penicillium angulare]|uniref:Uncharacterized protein n=1 Tax=Penicillium angulare TaxID=116970 RepID=A0A9W9GD94_9EURO|nr:hypothetical protein N7456_001027 [Penicillium angulare]